MTGATAAGDPWVDGVESLRYVSREGDRVRVEAPADSLAKPYDGLEGSILEFRGGWVVVRIDGQGDVRFRADELLTL